MLLLPLLDTHSILVFPLSFLGPSRVLGSFPGSVTFEVLLLSISQEAQGPGRRAKKEFRKEPPGDNRGNSVSLGKELVPSEEDVGSPYTQFPKSVPKDSLSLVPL